MSATSKIVLEGVVAGVTVVLGVVVAEVLAWNRSRRERIEQSVEELALAIPRYISHFRQTPNSPTPASSSFDRLHEQIVKGVAGIRFNARFPMRGRDAIRDEAEELGAKLTAVWFRYEKGTPATVEDMMNVNVTKLRKAVLRKDHPPLEERFEKYERDGIPPDED